MGDQPMPVCMLNPMLGSWGWRGWRFGCLDVGEGEGVNVESSRVGREDLGMGKGMMRRNRKRTKSCWIY